MYNNDKDMNFITKKHCISNINNSFKSSMIICLIGILFLYIMSLISESNYGWIYYALAIPFAVICYLFQLKRIKAIKNNKFFIVKDKLVSFKKGRMFTNLVTVLSECYTLYFECYGRYYIPYYYKNEKSDANYIIATDTNEKDQFYLVIANDKIVNAFNSKYYEVDESEFSLADGKWIPKA